MACVRRPRLLDAGGLVLQLVECEAPCKHCVPATHEEVLRLLAASCLPLGPPCRWPRHVSMATNKLRQCMHSPHPADRWPILLST
jgi:hypothetical protein